MSNRSPKKDEIFIEKSVHGFWLLDKRKWKNWDGPRIYKKKSLTTKEKLLVKYFSTKFNLHRQEFKSCIEFLEENGL